MLIEIGKNLNLIQNNIRNACRTYNLKEKEINVVAVSKTRNQEEIMAAIGFGCNIFGENYIQEAKEKWLLLKKEHPKVKLHFIGHLQSNKVSEALELFDVIETLDREKLAISFKKEIEKHQLLDANFQPPEFFIQVNIGQESQKGGIDPALVKDFLNFTRNDCNLSVSGLMCIPPDGENPALYFAMLAKIAKENDIKNLSMGMSADYESAIALGSNYIRIGTALFGERNAV